VRRVLSLRDLVFLASASMAPGFSLATTFGPITAASGGWAPWIVLAVGALMACIAGGYRLLGRRYPDAGSSYAWVGHAFGARAGAYAAWTLLVANLFAVLATALPAAAYTLDLLAPQLAADPRATAFVGVGWILAASALLVLGLRLTTVVAAVLLGAEFVVLAAAAVFALLRPVVVESAASAPPPMGAIGLATALAVGIWMIDGWEVSASTAEEAHGTSDTPGTGGMLGLAATIVLLVLCSVAYLRVGSVAGFLDHTNDALAYVGGALGGWWKTALAVTVLVSIASTLQTTLVYLSRSMYAMGRDGVLPRPLGALDRRSEPTAAVLVIAIVSSACALATGFSPSAKAGFDVVLGATSVFIGLLFLWSAMAAVATFRASRGTERLYGFALPLLACVVLVPILLLATVQRDATGRVFIGLAAALGVPFALFRKPGLHGVQTG
jgi:amino acid transporter